MPPLPEPAAVRYARGVYLPAHDLWLDPHDDVPFAFVSHAHSDHIGKHREVILSTVTSRLMHARLPDQRRAEHRLDFGVAATNIRAGLRITLYPAGHIAGSAQSLVESDDGTGSILYTGDFKLRAGLSAEKTQWTQADTLIMETTFGRPQFRFPPTEEVLGQVVKFCREALEDEVVPVLFGYSLGKSQEILCALDRAGLPAMLHGAVHRMTEIYRELQPDFPHFERYDPANLVGKVLICPPSANHSRMLQKIKARRTAMLSGWAMLPGAVHRYQTDAAFPLSDHADYPDLIKYVELVKPRRVLTLHGYAAEFARDLRARGVDAWALTEENQMELTLALGGVEEQQTSIAQDVLAEDPDDPRPSETPTAGSFAAFAQVGDAIAATTGKLRKIELLSTYFRTLDEMSLPPSANFLAGRAFAQSDSRVMNIGGAVIYRALISISGLSKARLREVSLGLGDLSEVAGKVLGGKTRPGPFSMTDAQTLFDDLERTRGPIKKGELLEAALARLAANEARYVIKILTGELRIGLKEGLLEEALAVAFGRPAEEIREANMLTGDLGRVALLARAGDLRAAELTLFQPIKCMLASPEPTAAAIWKRHEELRAAAEAAGQRDALADAGSPLVSALPSSLILQPSSYPSVVWVEDKFDGVRAQLHRSAEGRVEIYSRDLRKVTAQFDEIATVVSAGMTDAVILDGEIVAYEEGRKLTFFDLQKRLGRRAPDLFMKEDVPIVFLVFDLIHLNGRPLLAEPLLERRRLLDALVVPFPTLRRVSVAQADSAGAIDAEFDAARARSNEGLIIKDPASAYTPGRRGLAWLKLKKELATLDVVVVGAEWGHGKRTNVLSDYTFAVRDDAGELKTIGKAYSGLTDGEILELTTHFQQSTLATRGKYHDVRPDVVLEIAFDSIQPSARHTSGLSMRFPRIKSIRRDKGPAEIDTVVYARSLVAGGGPAEGSGKMVKGSFGGKTRK